MNKFKKKKKPFLPGETDLQKKLDNLKKQCQLHIDKMRGLSYSDNEILENSKRLYRTSLRKIFTDRFERGKKIEPLKFEDFMKYRILKGYAGSVFFDCIVEFIKKEYDQDFKNSEYLNIETTLLNNN